MGLDVYLYRYENREKTEKLEAEYEKVSESNWEIFDGKKYDSLTDAEKDLVRQKNKEFALSLGLSENGDDPDKKGIEFVSSRFPDHYFKVGYFRSSYNGGGINRIMGNLGLPGLYEIFDRGDDEDYIWAPDWEASRVRALDAIVKLKAKPNLRCFEVSLNELSDTSKFEAINEETALELFEEQSKRFRDDDDGYSNLQGHFFPKGLKVFGLITGLKQTLFSKMSLPGVPDQSPCTYVIMEGENEWYVNALEIVVETIDYVLTQPDKEKYFFHWSG